MTSADTPVVEMPRTKLQRIEAALLDVFATLIWLFVLVKLFVIDVDRLLVERLFPNFVWFLNFRAVILLALLALLWRILGNKKMLLTALFVVFYPVILLFYLCIFLYKQKSWNLAFAFFNSVFVFLRSFKRNLFAAAIFLVAASCVFLFSVPALLALSLIAIFCLLLAAYFRSLVFTLKPSGVFQVYQNTFGYIRRKGGQFLTIDQEMKTVSPTEFNPTQLQKWTNNLQSSVLVNRAALFTARRLKDYQRSNFNVLSYVATVLILVVFTVVVFALSNFALYRLAPANYLVTRPPGFFLFFYYSFNRLFMQSIAEIAPVAVIAQVVLMAEAFCELFLLGILFTLLLSLKRQTYIDELDEVIAGLKQESAEMESLIKSEYRLNSIRDAIVELQRLKSGMLSLILWFSNRVSDDEI